MSDSYSSRDNAVKYYDITKFYEYDAEEITWAISAALPSYYDGVSAPNYGYMFGSHFDLRGNVNQYDGTIASAYIDLAGVIFTTVSRITDDIEDAEIVLNGTTNTTGPAAVSFNLIGRAEADIEPLRRDIWITSHGAGYDLDLLKLMVMHETMHSLGFKHPLGEEVDGGDTGITSDPTNTVFDSPVHLQSRKFTVMSDVLP